MKRLFIAVDIPSSIKTALGEIQEELKPDIRAAKWVAREGMHITIKFLGACEVSVIDRMNERLDKVAQKISSFDFVLTTVGVFPSIKRARVLWAGAGDNFREFRELAKATDDKFVKLGFVPEKRPFHPHVTLARIRDPHPVDEQVLEHAGMSLPEDTITANSLILFESKLSPKGATYIKVSEHPLK